MQQLSPRARRYASLFAIIGWITLLVQLYLAVVNRVVSLPETILRYFNFFTILTNIYVSLSYTAVWLNPASGALRKLASSASLTAVTIYILIVGIIDNLLLRGLLDLHGLRAITDEFLHVVIPVSFLLFWCIYVSKDGLEWKMAVRWLWYPVLYIIYIIIVGALTGFYPYPFANVTELGYAKALLNGVWIIAAFLVLSVIFIGIARSISRKR